MRDVSILVRSDSGIIDEEALVRVAAGARQVPFVGEYHLRSNMYTIGTEPRVISKRLSAISSIGRFESTRLTIELKGTGLVP